MFFRLIGLVVAFLLTMPLVSFASRMVSAKDDYMVAVGFVTYIVLVVAWYYILRYFYRYFKNRFSPNTVKMMFAFVLLGSAVCLTGCGRTVVEPGHVGIVVNSYGTNKGVSSYPAVTGVVWYNPFTTDVSCGLNISVII